VLKILDYSTLKKSPMGIANLITLYVQENWWENVMWEDNNMKIYLHKVFKIEKK
jgi:hypothetical protein